MNLSEEPSEEQPSCVQDLSVPAEHNLQRLTDERCGGENPVYHATPEVVRELFIRLYKLAYKFQAPDIHEKGADYAAEVQEQLIALIAEMVESFGIANNITAMRWLRSDVMSVGLHARNAYDEYILRRAIQN